MKREIIKIDEEKCNGCGLCIPSCPEGALQMIDGKARLVSDLMCDGLGACIGECPEGAIEIEEREAEPYNETIVIKEIIKHGGNTVIAHLKHLKEHNETSYLQEAIRYMESTSDTLDFDLQQVKHAVHHAEQEVSNLISGGCPGAATRDFRVNMDQVENAGKGEVQVNTDELRSELMQWPVQMHLVNPNAPYFRDADVLLAADCVAFSMGNFHQKYLKDHSLAIACPKLDQGKEMYVEKLRAMIDEARINTLTVMVMEVPCCSGLLQLAQAAMERASRKVPVKKIIIGVKGSILEEEWV
jgi:NAD-dependent dihydropyrimidine dehydrogenase PreA subunit